MKIPLMFALVGTLGSAVWAQPKDDAATLPLPQTVPRTYQIRVRNVPPSLMAYWLDPANQLRPSLLGPEPQGKTGTSPAVAKGMSLLPAGVTRIVSVDPQNTLLVFGTPEGVARLQATINFLDRPLRQVEIEAQFVRINASDLGAFGLDAFNTKTEPNSPQPNRMFGFIRGNFSAALTALVAAGKAKVITAPRVLSINNLTSSLSQSTTTPVEIGVRDAKGTLQPLENGNFLEGAPVFVTTELKLEMTPTINNDDTITIALATGATRHLVTNESTTVKAATIVNRFPAPDASTDSSLKTVANLRDGETIALGGVNFLTPPQLPGAAPAQADSTAMVLFVTARIVRRVGE